MKQSEKNILERFDKKFDGDLVQFYGGGAEHDSITRKNLKNFLLQEVRKVKDHYEKELKIADDRWKANEKYRDRYMEEQPTLSLCPKCNCMIKPQPIGVSKWKKYGKKYGYWDYFVRKAEKRERKRIEKGAEKIRDKKFPRGERRWCVECASRIHTQLKSLINNK